MDFEVKTKLSPFRFTKANIIRFTFKTKNNIFILTDLF